MYMYHIMNHMSCTMSDRYLFLHVRLAAFHVLHPQIPLPRYNTIRDRPNTQISLPPTNPARQGKQVKSLQRLKQQTIHSELTLHITSKYNGPISAQLLSRSKVVFANRTFPYNYFPWQGGSKTAQLRIPKQFQRSNISM